MVEASVASATTSATNWEVFPMAVFQEGMSREYGIQEPALRPVVLLDACRNQCASRKFQSLVGHLVLRGHCMMEFVADMGLMERHQDQLVRPASHLESRWEHRLPMAHWQERH